MYTRNLFSKRFVWSIAVWITCLIIANIVAVKLLAVGPWILPAGTLVFPIVYILNDVITEVYGLKVARTTIVLGFLCNLLAVMVFALAQILPAPSFWDGQDAYVRILGYTPRLLLASFVAYLIGSNVNAWVMHVMKRITRGRWLWTRTIGSTIIGEGLDSLVFILIAFAGTMTGGSVVTTILTQWGFKVAYETLATPLTYWVINKYKRAEGVS